VALVGEAARSNGPGEHREVSIARFWKERPGLVLVALLLTVAARAGASPAPTAAGSDDTDARAKSAAFNKLAREAYRNKDWPALLENARAAERLRPGTAGLVFNVAIAEARMGHADESARLLDGLLDRGLDFGIEGEEDFAAVRNTPAFAALFRHAAQLAKPAGKSEVAFRIPERDLLTEGIAWDPKTRSFFVSSVHQRKIVRRGPDGKLSDFIASGRDGIDGVLALRVDPKRRILWACSAALPQAAGVEKTRQGSSGLFAYDIDKATLIAKYELPKDGKAHALNDLAISAEGDLYATDSLGSGVYRLSRGAVELEEFIAPGAFRSPQGLAFSEDGRRLIIADWSDGLWSVDVASRKREPVAGPPGVEQIGIDGLAARGSELFVVQNLARPHRVARLVLDDGGTRILRGEILLASDPEFAEPTLGVIAGDFFYVIAKSQWGLFDDSGAVASEKLQEPTVLKIPLSQKGVQLTRP
jgi:sugar lactone lactonase YvrE